MCVIKNGNIVSNLWECIHWRLISSRPSRGSIFAESNRFILITCAESIRFLSMPISVAYMRKKIFNKHVSGCLWYGLVSSDGLMEKRMLCCILSICNRLSGPVRRKGKESACYCVLTAWLASNFSKKKKEIYKSLHKVKTQFIKVQLAIKRCS